MSFETVTIGPCTLIRGDCLEVLPTLDEACAGVVYTDPPFTSAGGSTNGRVLDADTQFFEHWLKDVCEQLRRCCAPSSCWLVHCDWKTIGSLQRAVAACGRNIRSEAFRVSQCLYWWRKHIGMGSPFRNEVELIAFVRGPRFKEFEDRAVGTLVEHYWPYGAKPHHGSEKPVALIDQLLLTVEPVKSLLCLDPFMGSGTTGVACASQGRQFIGIEMDDQHFETACERVTKAWHLERSKLPLEKPVTYRQPELIEA